MNKIQFFIIALVLTSCNYLNKESSENVIVSKTVSNEVSFTDSTEQKKIEDSIIIHLGTFLGNEKILIFVFSWEITRETTRKPLEIQFPPRVQFRPQIQFWCILVLGKRLSN